MKTYVQTAGAILLSSVLLAAGALFAGEPAPADKPAPKAVKKPQPPKRTPALVEKGKKAYTMFCVACHGAAGDGKGPAGAALKPPPRNFVKDKFVAGSTTADIYNTVTHGLPKTLMVGYKHIPEEDRWGIAYYVGDFIPKKKK